MFGHFSISNIYIGDVCFILLVCVYVCVCVCVCVGRGEEREWGKGRKGRHTRIVPIGNIKIISENKGHDLV